MVTAGGQRLEDKRDVLAGDGVPLLVLASKADSDRA
jgi:hypothetical protein